MGNEPNKKTVIDAREDKGSSPSSKPDERFLAYVRQAFRNCATNGYLTKDKFNQALAVLESLGFKRLRDTPLADRLFYVFDKSKTGSISEEEFSKGIAEVVNDRSAAIAYTFRAYDSDGDNQVSKREFMQLVEESWRVAFRLLAEVGDSKKMGGVTMQDIDNWANSKVSLLNEHSAKLFNRMDSQKHGFVSFQAFRQYITDSGFNDITASIGQTKVVIPLNLTHLYGQ